MPALSLVIPCYNEAKNISDLVNRCTEVLASADLEIILVDNGSTDDTPQILAALKDGKPNLRSVRVEVNEGYGHGILEGLRSATGGILAWTHADLQTDPIDILAGLDIFKKHPTDRLFIKGRRYGRPLTDVLFTIGMSCFETFLFRKVFWDVNGQPTMFPRTLFESWQNPPKDFSLDMFAYWSARMQGYEIRRFPVRFGARSNGTQSSWNFGLKSRLKMVRRVIGYSWHLRRKLAG